ncbi:MAG: recombinase family protein [Flavobacteriales bacterium]|nr:recombinase family protein [Flavobacteriales bacterium]
MGKIEVPAFDNEPHKIIEGNHDGLISEELYFKVQEVLSGNQPKKRVSSSIQNEVLPLRGILKCSSCGEKLTGSHSRGKMGTRYAYYHCNHCHQERYRTEMVNDAITEILDSMRFSRSSKEIFEEIVKRLLNGDVKSKKVEIKKLQEIISKQEERIERLQDNLADNVISTDDYMTMRSRYSQAKQEAQNELRKFREDASDKTNLIEKAVSTIESLGQGYKKADAEAKIRLLSSIFPEMIEFDGKKCRTPKINQAVALCLSIDKGFREKENRTIHEKLELSGLVAPSRIELLSKV